MSLRSSNGKTISIRFEGDRSGYERTAGEVDRSLDSITKKADSLGGKFTSAGRAMAPLSAALTLAGGVALKFSTDFNRGMANVATLIPGNTKRVNELKGTVQNLAVATGKATDDLAEGLYQTISAFGDTADTAAILETNAKAAAAGLAKTTDAINLTSAVTKIYGDTSAAAVQKAADLALLTVRLGQTTFPELASSMGKVVPMAEAMGQSQEDLFAVFATATGVTGTAAEVATQYRGVLAGLAKPSEALTALLDKQGFKSGEAMLAQRGLVGTLQDIVGAAKDADKPLQDYIASVEAVPFALALAGPQAETFAKKQAELAKAAGATDEAFRAQTEGVNEAGFGWDQLVQQFVTGAQKLGDVLLPRLLDAAHALSPLWDLVKMTGRFRPRPW
jgi:TP901 family phage tail tape measure protein